MDNVNMCTFKRWYGMNGKKYLQLAYRAENKINHDP